MRTPGRRRAWAGFTWILRAPRRWRLSLIGRWPSCTIFGTCALERFTQVAKNDPQCAMAYWGAAMTYNHPFWDPPSPADEMAAWALVQKGMSAQEASAREKLYLVAVAALYQDAGAGTKRERDQHYRDAMAAAYAKYPDDETALLYGLPILGAIPEGTKGFEQQEQAAKLFETSMPTNRTIRVCCTTSFTPTMIPSTHSRV